MLSEKVCWGVDRWGYQLLERKNKRKEIDERSWSFVDKEEEQ